MALNDFVIASYRLTINSPLHWVIVVLAVISLVISCWLIYQGFTRELSNNLPKKAPLRFRQKAHLSLLIFANIIAFFSVLLFVLPFEKQVQTPMFDMLLTAGFKHKVTNDDFNNIDMSNEKILYSLRLAEHIWLLSDENDVMENQPLYQWLVTNYRDKVFVINSIQVLTDLWASAATKNTQLFGLNHKVPSLIQILGDGLTRAQWQHLAAFNQQKRVQHSSNTAQSPNIEFSFYASKPLTGVTNLHWRRQLLLGQALTVTGQLQQTFTANRQFQLSLVNNNVVLDSIIIAGNETFSLAATSKIPGLFSYQLILTELSKKQSKQGFKNQAIASNSLTNLNVLNEKTVLKISEDIAFSVATGNKPRVLIKQSAPSFETRRLKQWLSQTGSKVQTISKISKNKWAQQQVNPVTLNAEISDNNAANTKLLSQGSKNTAQGKLLGQAHLLTQRLLAEHDFLMIDSRMLLSLEQTEVDALYRAVKQGLGLLINADASLLQFNHSVADKRSQLLSLFTITAVDESLSRVVASWPDKPVQDVSQTITPQTISIVISSKKHQGINSLIQSTTGQTLVAKQSFGLGTVAISTLNQTHQWALQATPALYSHYWQYLFSAISRSQNSTRWLSSKPAMLALANQSQDICLISPLETVYAPAMQLSSYPLSKHKKCALFSAHQAGWFEFTALTEKQVLLAKQARYFYGNNKFLAWQQAIKHNASRRYESEAPTANRVLSGREVNAAATYRQINKLYLWLIMFISLALLWLERKWHAG